MTAAIFEILALLIVSCLIGIYFTNRYWKSKTAPLKQSLEDNQRALDSAQQKLTESRSIIESQEREIKKLNEAQKPAQKEKPASSKKEPDIDKLKKDIKSLQDQNELQSQSLDEKEREIEELSRELAEKKISYYKQIDGKRYKAITLLKADQAVEGKGDGRISMADAEEIFATISDGKAYTQVEKDTMRYLRDNYNWTESADELFRKKVRSWAAKGHELD